MSTELRVEPAWQAPLLSPFIRAFEARDRGPLAELLAKDGLFTGEEVAVALELLDAALQGAASGYRALVAENAGRVAGYVCFGPTPMTDGTWDLYWIATHPEARGLGLGRALVTRMESDLRGIGARLVRVETSQLDGYGAAHAFYTRLGYPVVARLSEFYRPGEDLLIMMKRL